MQLIESDRLWSLVPGLAGALEFFGGLLLLVGLATRPVAFILSGLMAFAYFMVHAPGSFWPVLNHGDAAILFCFVFLYLSAKGPGPFSADQLIERGRARRARGVNARRHVAGRLTVTIRFPRKRRTAAAPTGFAEMLRLAGTSASTKQDLRDRKQSLPAKPTRWG